MLRDIRAAFRGLIHLKIVSLAAVLAIALGIGANTTVFSILKVVLLEPVPFKQPDHLVLINEVRAQKQEQHLVLPQNFAEWKKDTSETFEQMSAIRQQEYVLNGSGEPIEL